MRMTITTTILLCVLTAIGSAEATAQGLPDPRPPGQVPQILPLKFTGSPDANERVPYGLAKQFTFTTAGGAGSVSITYSVSGVDSSLFRVPTSGRPVSAAERVASAAARLSPAPNVSRTIEFVGAPGFAVPTAAAQLTVTAADSANGAVTKVITINFTKANGSPVIRSVSQTGDPFDGKFHVEVQPGTWSLDDENAAYFAIYANNYKYDGRNATVSGNTFTIVFDDLNRGRTIQIVLRNIYGDSAPVSVTYNKYPFEPILTGPLAPATAGNRSYALFTHGGVIPAQGTDEFLFSTINFGDPGKTSLACNETGSVYVGSALLVFDQLFGSARIESEPAKGQLLQPGQKVRAHWEHGIGHVDFQIIPSFRGMVGVCSNRVR